MILISIALGVLLWYVIYSRKRTKRKYRVDQVLFSTTSKKDSVALNRNLHSLIDATKNIKAMIDATKNIKATAVDDATLKERNCKLI